MRILRAQPIFSGKKGTMTRPARKPYTHLPPPSAYRIRRFLSQGFALLTTFPAENSRLLRQKAQKLARHFFNTKISFSYHRAFPLEPQKFALISAFAPSRFFQQKLFQCLKNLVSGLQKFFCRTPRPRCWLERCEYLFALRVCAGRCPVCKNKQFHPRADVLRMKKEQEHGN